MVELILLVASAAFIFGSIIFAIAERTQKDVMANIAMGMISLSIMAIGAIIAVVTTVNLIATPPAAPLLWLAVGLWATTIAMIVVGLVMFGLGVVGLRVALNI